MGIDINQHISLQELDQLSEISSINEFNFFVGLKRLSYLSQFSSAVLIGGLDHPSRDSFDYERNTRSLCYGYELTTEKDRLKWCAAQANHPSFALSTATLFSNTQH